MRFISAILTWTGNFFLALVIISILGAIIALVSFGITFGARSGWRLSEQWTDQYKIEHVEGSIRTTTVNP